MSHVVRGALGAIAVTLTTAVLLTGCAVTPQPAPVDNATAAGPAVAAVPAAFNRPASGGAGGGGSSTPAPTFPASWPRDVPVPAGKLIGSTSSTGRWTLLLLEPGSAAGVLQLAGTFYKAAGFTAVSAAVLNKGNRHITLVVENRDHSATKTNLVIQLTAP